MPNLWDVTYAAPAAIRGKHSGLNWSSLISWEMGVVGTSSQNHGTVGSTLGLPETFHHDSMEHFNLLDEWEMYVRKPWWTRETGSRHIYGDWIFMGIESAWVYATLDKRLGLAQDLRLNIRSSLAMMALSAAPFKQGRYPGPRVCLTGSRSAISDKSSGSRFEPGGGPTPIMFLEDNPLDYRLGAYTGLSNRQGLWLDDQWGAYKEVHGFTPYDAITEDEREVLIGIFSGGTDFLPDILSWLAVGPLPAIPMRFRRTREGVVCFAEKAISPNSTPMQYAHAWFKNGLPADGWWNDVSWTPDKVLWLAVDDYRYRSQGESGVCRLVDGELKAQTTAGDYWSETTREHINGWKIMPIPKGELVYDIRVDKNGVELLSGDAPDPDPDPVSGPRRKIRKDLKKMTDADAKLLRTIQVRFLQ